MIAAIDYTAVSTPGAGSLDAIGSGARLTANDFASRALTSGVLDNAFTHALSLSLAHTR